MSSEQTHVNACVNVSWDACKLLVMHELFMACVQLLYMLLANVVKSSIRDNSNSKSMEIAGLSFEHDSS